MISRSRLKAREIKIKLEECFTFNKNFNDKKDIPELAIDLALQTSIKFVQISNRFCYASCTNGKRSEQLNRAHEKNIKQLSAQIKRAKKPMIAGLF